jgi:hypothetical protein
MLESVSAAIDFIAIQRRQPAKNIFLHDIYVIGQVVLCREQIDERERDIAK